MQSDNQIVIGTAGHVDHGKSSLIKKLTGVDPDHLKEEKNRGLSIQPGFGWTFLPSGKKVSIVDLPGHERFIKNMIIGASGLDFVILVISAEEGIMPQTLEHCSILRAFGINEGIIVVSKKDLVDNDWLNFATEEIKSHLTEKKFFVDSPILSISIKDDLSVDNLKKVIDEKIEHINNNKNINPSIIPIDRVFNVKGFGTVVAGKLSNKIINIGEQLELLPQKILVRIKNLEVHGNKVETAYPGNRVAINLAINDSTKLDKGNLLASPNQIKPTKAFDGYFHSEIDANIKHNHKVTIFTNTDEKEGIIRILGKKNDDGKSWWVQIKSNEYINPIVGTRFLIRDSNKNLGSGIILIPEGKRYRKNYLPNIIEKLNNLYTKNYSELIINELKNTPFTTIENLCSLYYLDQDIITNNTEKLRSEKKISYIYNNENQYIILSKRFDTYMMKINQIIGSYHDLFPYKIGITIEDCRKKIDLSQKHFQIILKELQSKKIIKIKSAIISLINHEATLSTEQEKEATNFIEELKRYKFSPPIDINISKEIINYLIEKKFITKISNDIYYEKNLADDLIEKILDLGKINNEITISSVRNKFGTSRKYTLAILEYMDSQNLTKRIDDKRYIR